MADKQISDLTSASAMTDGSLFVIEQGGAAKSANWGMVKNYISPGVAAQYSSSAIYNVGDYVIYNGSLYRCTTAITTAETWTAAHWTQVALAGDVADLRNAFNQTCKTKNVMFLNNDYIAQFTGILKVDVTVPESLKSHLYHLCMFGYSTENNRFYIGLYDETLNRTDVYSYKAYTSKPTTGIEAIKFSTFYDEQVSGGLYSLSVVIDWSKYVGTFYNLQNNLYTPIVNTNVADDGVVSENVYRYIRGVYDVPVKYLNLFKCIKDINIKVPGSIVGHLFSISLLGYNSTYNRFYFGLFDVTANRYEAYTFKQYTARPTSGIETVVFDAYYDPVVSDGEYYYTATIDWSKWDSSYYYEQAGANGIKFVAESTSLENVIAGSTLLTGKYTLNSAVTLSDNQAIVGANCTIVCGANAKINMGNGSSITNVKFVGSWSPTRTHGDGSTCTEYGYVPLISTSDLSGEVSDALFGPNNSATDALIYIADTKANNTKIDSCRFEGFNKPCIYSGGETHESNKNAIICGCYFTDCRMGIYVKGEFQRIYGNQYFRCVIGVYLLGSNVNLCCEIYKCCDCGIFFPTNAIAHNEITSIEAAHCGLCGIYIKSFVQNTGITISGSQIVDSAVIGEDVDNVLIIGCRLDTYFKYTTGEKNSIMCNNVRNAYLYGNPIYDVPADTQITLNRGMGISDTIVNTI